MESPYRWVPHPKTQNVPIHLSDSYIQQLIFPSNLPKSYLTSRNNPREAPMLGTTIFHYRILEKIGEVRWGKCLAWRILI